MLSDPGRVEAVSLRVNDLLRSEAIPLSCGRLIEKPSEEAEPSWTSPRHEGIRILFVPGSREQDRGRVALHL
jgi:hypothetical protein